MNPPFEDYRGVLLTVAYDGSEFSGWATQRDERTVEDTIRGAIVALDPKASLPRGSSRTDAGVHAEGQLVAFDTILPFPARGWVLELNRHLPDDVAVRGASFVPTGYNPRFTSRKKRYRYCIVQDKIRHPLLRARAWRVGYELDIDKLTREATALVGTHDFAAFRSATDVRVETTRTIHSVTVHRSADDERLLYVDVVGSAFLHNMMRIVVGTLVDVARDNIEEGAVERALAGKDRALAGQTAPAHGLTLAEIDVDLSGMAGTDGDRWPR